MKEEEMNQYKNAFDKLSEIEKWQSIKSSQHLGITVYLDNDDTFAQFFYDTDADYLLQFNEYLGCSEGACNLLESIGIEADGV